MILFNDFFKRTGEAVLNSDGSRSVSVLLNPKHYIYKAHFPNHPVTPGVCILQMAEELLEQALGTNLRIQTIDNVKFLSLLVPHKGVPVSFTFSTTLTDDGRVRMCCDVTEGNRIIAKLLITYAAAEEKIIR